MRRITVSKEVYELASGHKFDTFEEAISMLDHRINNIAIDLSRDLLKLNDPVSMSSYIIDNIDKFVEINKLLIDKMPIV